MYENFYKFEKPPFKLVADPSMLFASKSAREALGRLEYAVKSGKGIAVMSGEVGMGKTTLVNRFLSKAGPDIKTAYIFNPTLSGLQLLKTLADELGIVTTSMAKMDLTKSIYEMLMRNKKSGLKTVVFVDEAQILSREALEELRLISNLETWQDKLLNIILVGQPELLLKLESWNLRQLRQRVELFIHIDPLDAFETEQYIAHRIRMANPLKKVQFTSNAAAEVHKRAGGIPRDINKLCDAALLVAFVDEAENITASHVREAVVTIDAQDISFQPRDDSSRGRSFRFLGMAAAGLATIALILSFDGSINWSEWKSALRRDSANSQEVSHERIDPGSHAPTVLVHLASFRVREQAESFAGELSMANGHLVYLQQVSNQEETWHRVFIGGFEDLETARIFADEAQTAGIFSYAQAVHVSSSNLETWSRKNRNTSP